MNKSAFSPQQSSRPSSIAEIVRILFVFFPVGTTLEMAQAYTEVLLRRRVDPLDLAAAVDAVIATRESNRPPPVAELLSRARTAWAARARSAGDVIPLRSVEGDRNRQMREAVDAWRREHRIFPGPEKMTEILRDLRFPPDAIAEFTGERPPAC